MATDTMKFTDKNGLNGYTFERNPRRSFQKELRRVKDLTNENLSGSIRRYFGTKKWVVNLQFPIIVEAQLNAMKYFFDLDDEFRFYEFPISLPSTYLKVIWENDFSFNKIQDNLFSLTVNLREV